VSIGATVMADGRVSTMSPGLRTPAAGNRPDAQTPSLRSATCPHRPPCPPADRPDHEAARTIVAHSEQGWSLLCNGVIVFDDTGELLPDGRVVPPHRATPVRLPATA
jgi:hypothetical protein